MTLRLSHSANEKYKVCPREYQLHYIEKLRQTGLASPLFFGKAIDEACENYAKDRVALRARQIFKDLWKQQEHNGTTIDLSESTEVQYRPADFDAELLLQSDNELILKDTVYASVSDIMAEGTEKERIAYANWISLYRKGLLLVNAWITWVDENVEELLGSQIQVSFNDEEGNEITGLADFVFKLYQHPNPMVVDLKTSAMFYDRNSVKDSDQLPLYFEYLKSKYPDMTHAGYMVLQKNIKKIRNKTCTKCGYTITGGRHKKCDNIIEEERCNGEWSIDTTLDVGVQFIYDEVTPEMTERVLTSFNINQERINAGEFPQVWENCTRYNGKIKCPFYEYCRSGSMEGLMCKKDKQNE